LPRQIDHARHLLDRVSEPDLVSDPGGKPS
jgi:hypothetical protein